MKLKKIYIEITNRCNLSCSFCSKSELKKRDMSVEEFKHIMEQVKPITNNIYLHVKGEPLLHTQLKEILTICEENNMRVNITTNGTLIKRNLEALISFSCVKKLNFSLHCEQKDDQYLENIFTSVDELKKKRTIVYRLWTMNNGSLDDRSIKTVDEIMKYYQLPLNKKEEIVTGQNIKISENIYVDKDNEFIWPALTNKNVNKEGYCYALKTHLAILVNGDVVPCCLDGEGIIHLGNIHEQSLTSIMRSERFQKIKKSFQDRKPCEELCQKCLFKNKFD